MTKNKHKRPNEQLISINKLQEAEYTPRQITDKQFQDILNSIKEFGFLSPIIANKNPKRENIVIGGHQRLRAAKTLKFKEVPVIYVDVSLERERELNIRLNKNTGEFDFDLLGNNFEIDELKEWGFTDYDLGIKADDLDYSLLDTDEVSDKLDNMTDGVRKSLMIDFNKDDYQTAYDLVDFMRRNEKYVGALLIEKLIEVKKDMEKIYQNLH